MANKGKKAVVPIALLALAVVLLLGSLTTVAAASSDPVVMPVKFPELQVSTQNGITTLKMEGCPNSREVGKPIVPVKGLTVAVPPDTVATKISVTSSSWSKLPGTYKVEWGQPVAPSEGPLPERVSKDSATYSSNSPYPETTAELKSTGRMRKVSLGDISLNPVRYYPESGVIEVCSEMTVRVDYRGASLSTSEKKADASPADVASVVDNPAQAQGWYTPLCQHQ